MRRVNQKKEETLQVQEVHLFRRVQRTISTVTGGAEVGWLLGTEARRPSVELRARTLPATMRARTRSEVLSARRVACHPVVSHALLWPPRQASDLQAHKRRQVGP